MNSSIECLFTGRDTSVRLLLRNDADADYAIKYATESLSKLPRKYGGDAYVGADTGYNGYNGYNGGYQRTIDTINANHTFWQRIKSYFECIRIL